MYYKYYVVIMVCVNVEANYLPGYSFHKFSGPVAGDIKVVKGPGQSVDYVAKPEYTYVYGVDDPYTGNSQAHQQTRDGDVVSGEYTVVEPDGAVRIVRYTADDNNGFQVQIHYIKPSEQAHTQSSQTTTGGKSGTRQRP